ncbi:MAG: nicotinate-nucleotide adenylyltransferase [Pyrinomonadaceae bacterium]
MKRVAVFGGTFDPVHVGHLMIARKLVELFKLDQFVFLPAFHAPHKPDRKPTSAFHRFAMLSIATRNDADISVSILELEKGQPRYTVETIPELKDIYFGSKLFFVMGADSWSEIKTWKRWKDVLKLTNHIIVSRPGYHLELNHVTDEVRKRIIDVRGSNVNIPEVENEYDSIYLTDSVFFDTSATELREDLSDGDLERVDEIPVEVAKYIEKYELY